MSVHLAAADRLHADLLRAGTAALLKPSSAVLVGASERFPELATNVQIGAFDGTWGVHPEHASVEGLACVPTIGALPIRPDVAVLAVGHRQLPAAFQQALDAGIRAFVLPGLGSEAGPEAASTTRQVKELADACGAAVLGPNCRGIGLPGRPSGWLATIPESFLPGSVGIVSQSGSIADAFVSLGPRIGFSAVVSCGAELNRDVADFVAEMAADDATRAIGVFVETVRRPVAFTEALRVAAAAGKPVVCLKIGKSEVGRRAALAHTGPIVGSQRAFSALLATHGVIEVQDLPEMIELLEVLSKSTRPAGLRVGAITESGAEAGLLADHAARHGLSLPDLDAGPRDALAAAYPQVAPTNPLDPWALANPVEVYPFGISTLAASGQFDILLGQVDLSRHRGPRYQRWCESVVQALADARARTGVYVAMTTVHNADPPDELARFALENDVAVLRGVSQAMGALAHAAWWSPVHSGEPAEHGAVSARELGIADLTGALSEDVSAAVLERVGVGFAPRGRAATVEEAVAMARDIGYPVVVKIDGPAHKAREGGVVLNVGSDEAVAAAMSAVAGPVLIARQVPAGVEAYCGMVRDPHYGPVYALGYGGSRVETIAPVLATGPLTSTVVDQMVGRAGLTRWSQWLGDAMLALSRLATDCPQIVEVDINPLICNDAGEVTAVDALVVLSDGLQATLPPAQRRRAVSA